MRKKLKIVEFKELGFLFNTTVSPRLSADDEIDLLERLILDVLQPRGLQMGGSLREAFVAKRSPGSATTVDLEAVRAWFQEQPDIDGFQVGSLTDAWYEEAGES